MTHHFLVVHPFGARVQVAIVVFDELRGLGVFFLCIL